MRFDECGCGGHEQPNVGRREFLAGASAAALAATATPLFGGQQQGVVETRIKELYDSLKGDQRKQLCFAANDPLRNKVSANWAITEKNIDQLGKSQQGLVREIFEGLCSERGREMFAVQMEDDYGGLGSYHIALFGDPSGDDFEFVLTGRHLTMRADGKKDDGVAFAGPMVYGHAAAGFDEPADHQGNVFWYQAKQANEVFAALDPKQREAALRERARREDAIQHRKSGYDGIAISELSADQKALVEKVMADLLAPYREQDAKEVMDVLTANGGLEKIHLAFYRNDPGGSNADIGKDGVWDVWRLEGPGFVWHFRGAPHVHTWVNIARMKSA